MSKLTLFVAVHGILTGRSNPTWPERFEQWAASNIPGAVVLTDHYTAGPFPLWNVLWQNPRASEAIDQLVENYLDGLDHPGQIDVHFIGHSNGCDIIRRSAIRLMNRGYNVASVLMFSAPCQSSAAKMGLDEFIDSGHLGRLVVYAADEDHVLAPKFDWRKPLTVLKNLFRWPYGNAGRVGISDADQRILRSGTEIIGRSVSVERMFPGWGHGDFFPLTNPGRMVGMFAVIARDSGVNPNHENQ